MRKSESYGNIAAPGSERVLTLPNVLSLARLLLALVGGGLYFLSSHKVGASGIFLLAACLDALDGWLARTLSQCTDLGRWADQLADKILIGIVFAALAFELDSALIWAAYALLMLREFLITCIRVLAARRYGFNIPSSRIGKWKMLSQSVVGIGLLVYGNAIAADFSAAMIPAYVLVMPIVLLSLVSAGQAWAFYAGRKRAPSTGYEEGMDRTRNESIRIAAGE
jgi:CDP-diacylglycerol--glycerol-3-phosphate 3-phosphatidyltransferase